MKLPLRVGVRITLEEVAAATGGRLSGDPKVAVEGVCLDTRALEPGDLFFALSAARDGHDFAAGAFRKGAAAAVVSKALALPGPLLRVEDTGGALLDLGRWVRRKWGGAVLCIGGANGKTTTKEMAAALLGSARNVLKTPGNWNNLLGVPLTLCLLRPEHEVAVVEMGINDFGEMTRLASAAEPTIGLLTSIGPAHLAKLGSLEGVARAEGELFAALGAGSVAVVNLDDPRIREAAGRAGARRVTVSQNERADVSARLLRDLGPEGVLLAVDYGGRAIELRSPFLGAHNVSNLLCALGAAWAMNVPADRLQEGIDRAVRPDLRLEIVELHGVRIINDCYNANPASVQAALRVAHGMKAARRFAVLGDMLELGDYAPRAHRDVGIEVARLRFDRLFALGQCAGDMAQGALQGGLSATQVTVGTSKAAVAEAVAESVRPGDCVLVKGSRGMKMEEFTRALAERMAGGKA